ncbi:MAG: hypothetical protein WBC40_04085 [Halobacteriota archaeon]
MKLRILTNLLKLTCDGFILSRRKCINKVMQEEGHGVEVISVVEFVEEKKWE